MNEEGAPIRALRKPKTQREVYREAHEAAGNTRHIEIGVRTAWCELGEEPTPAAALEIAADYGTAT